MDAKFHCKVRVKCYKRVAIIFVIHRRCQGTESRMFFFPFFGT